MEKIHDYFRCNRKNCEKCRQESFNTLIYSQTKEIANMQITSSEIIELKKIKKIINDLPKKEKWTLKYGNKLFSKGWVSLSTFKHHKIFIFYKYNNCFYLWDNIDKLYEPKAYKFKEMTNVIFELIKQ